MLWFPQLSINLGVEFIIYISGWCCDKTNFKSMSSVVSKGRMRPPKKRLEIETGGEGGVLKSVV